MAGSIKVTKDGTLQLPYDQDYAMAQYQAVAQANNDLLDLKNQSDTYEHQFARGMRDANLEYGSLQGQTRNTHSARGTALSSAYGTSVANNASAYARKIGDMQSDRGLFQNDILARQAAIQSSLKSQIGASTQQYAHGLGGKAGTLGYGQAKASVSKPIKRTPKSKKKSTKKRWVSAASKSLKRR